MDSMLILIPVFAPVAAGLMMLTFRPKESTNKKILIECLMVFLAAAVWYLALNTPQKSFTLIRITENFAVRFKIDGFSKLFSVMSASMWVLVTVYAFEYMKDDKRQNTFFAFFIMSFGITQAVSFSANLITMYVFYEMFTLITLPLVTHYNNSESRYAGRKYAVYSISGSAFAFAGIIYLEKFFHTTEFIAGGFVSAAAADKGFLCGVYLIMFFGFGVKAAVFPFSGWLPTAGVAPTPVTGLLHAVAVVKAGIFAIIRLTYYSFGPDFLTGTYAQSVALAFAIFTMLYGAIKALKENHLKRRLAYSTVSNLSYIITAAMLLTRDALTAALCHMVFHGIIKITAFMCAGAFMHETGLEYIFEFDGIGKKMPVTSAFYTLSALSLMGIPSLCGFISKYLLISASITDSAYGIFPALALTVASLICAAYMLGVCIHIYFPRNKRDLYSKSNVHEAGPMMLVPIGIFCVVNIFFGICPSFVTDFAAAISAGIF